MILTPTTAAGLARRATLPMDLLREARVVLGFRRAGYFGTPGSRFWVELYQQLGSEQMLLVLWQNGCGQMIFCDAILDALHFARDHQTMLDAATLEMCGDEDGDG
jgi:hypothetical protein